MADRKQDDAGLDGEVAIVAGGGAAADGIGNGRAAAMLLARSGTKVLVVDRALSLAQRTVAMILAEGGDAAAHETVVTSESECNGLVTAEHDNFGRNQKSVVEVKSVTVRVVVGGRRVIEKKTSQQ